MGFLAEKICTGNETETLEIGEFPIYYPQIPGGKSLEQERTFMFIHDERKGIIYCQLLFYSFTYNLLFNYSSFLHSGQCRAASMMCP